ncbi:MAG: crossover junction endodeoxyribonuclease RuvC [Candidatus Pacebacteria bacterium]|nr:crossover junction endodeoxyribonuclease RuvC [Candidatus Paceibacterota bacterium]
MRILGIDPGTATTGYGAIVTKRKSDKFVCVEYGIIHTSVDLSQSERLKKIEREILKLINKFEPHLIAIERLYFFKNSKTAISVSQAKGVILLAAAKKKVPIIEFTPLEVKMTIVGYGRAKKTQIQKMIKTLLNLEETPKPDDAADALALAICAHFANFSLLKNVEKTLDKG